MVTLAFQKDEDVLIPEAAQTPSATATTHAKMEESLVSIAVEQTEGNEQRMAEQTPLFKQPEMTQPAEVCSSIVHARVLNPNINVLRISVLGPEMHVTQDACRTHELNNGT